MSKIVPFCETSIIITYNVQFYNFCHKYKIDYSKQRSACDCTVVGNNFVLDFSVMQDL